MQVFHLKLKLCNALYAQMQWHLGKTSILKNDRQLQTVSLHTRQRARATIRAVNKMCLDDIKTYRTA